ncbi:MAG: non-canonical purine NTP pyrophosphatase, RdgB/HAM1 family [Ignavibacteria bacterium RBG_13_36_8]|nr:MAG: non-canonical purine NTP pyrophosphatase, RdgB/HAM1 family [Ignavibacteria bacterium RBG_13_36_8]
MKIIFATANKGKLMEVRNIFSDTKFKILSPYELGAVPEIEETEDTFEGNALLKAKTIYDLYKIPSIADDSGLSVDQLKGAPGVLSARYAGENCTYHDNNVKLIGELKSFPEPHTAKFISCAVYYDGKNNTTAVGELPGKIIHEFRGANGFGYDPIFLPDGFGKTLAEMTLEEKNKISHRARAFSSLKSVLLKIGMKENL